MDRKEYERHYKDKENYNDYKNEKCISKSELNRLIRGDTWSEYAKGYNEKYLEDVLFRKIEDKKINDTYNLSKEICEYIDKCVYNITEDMDMFVEYVNSKIIIRENQVSKDIFDNNKVKWKNKAKKGKLEKYKRSKVVECMIMPYLEFDEQVDSYQIQANNHCSFRNYIRNNDEFTNILTLEPNILAFIMLCEKRKYSKLGTSFNRKIIRDYWNEYSVSDLFDFYKKLYRFILTSQENLKVKKVNTDDYSEYFEVGYNLFEAIYKGDRYLFILENLIKYNVNIDYKVNSDYKTSLYLGIALMIDDVKLSKKVIEKIIEYSSMHKDDEIEEIVYRILKYHSYIYGYIDSIINKAIDKRTYEVKNDKKGLLPIEEFIDRYSKFAKINRLSKKEGNLNNFSDKVFNILKTCDDFLSYEGILDYLYESRSEKINSKLSMEKVFMQNDGTIYLILGGYIQYCKE